MRGSRTDRTALLAGALLKLKLFTAAADANPSNVRTVAEAGMREFAGVYKEWDRAKVMAALAALGDAADRESAVKWFYDEPNKDGGSSTQSVFIHELQRRRPKSWREIVRGIVSRPAFDQLRPIDVMYLAFLVEKLGETNKFITPGLSLRRSRRSHS